MPPNTRMGSRIHVIPSKPSNLINKMASILEFLGYLVYDFLDLIVRMLSKAFLFSYNVTPLLYYPQYKLNTNFLSSMPWHAGT